MRYGEVVGEREEERGKREVRGGDADNEFPMHEVTLVGKGDMLIP